MHKYSISSVSHFTPFVYSIIFSKTSPLRNTTMKICHSRKFSRANETQQCRYLRKRLPTCTYPYEMRLIALPLRTCGCCFSDLHLSVLARLSCRCPLTYIQKFIQYLCAAHPLQRFNLNRTVMQTHTYRHRPVYVLTAWILFISRPRSGSKEQKLCFISLPPTSKHFQLEQEKACTAFLSFACAAALHSPRTNAHNAVRAI